MVGIGEGVAVSPGASAGEDAAMIVDGSHIDVAESVPVGRIVSGGAVVDDPAAELAGDVIAGPVLVGAEEPVNAAVVPLLAVDPVGVVDSPVSVVKLAGDELTLPVSVGCVLPELAIVVDPVSVEFSGGGIPVLVGALDPTVPVIVGVVLPPGELGVVVGALPGSLDVSEPRMLDKMLPRPVLSGGAVDEAAGGSDEVGVTGTPVDAPPVTPSAVDEGAEVSVRLAMIEERRLEEATSVVDATALETTEIKELRGSAVAVGSDDDTSAAELLRGSAVEVGGATTLDTSEAMLLTNEIKAGALEEAAGAVVTALPENDTPDDVTLASVVLAAGDGSTEDDVRIPLGPNVMPLPAAEEATEESAVAVSGSTLEALVGRTMIDGIDPDEAAAVEGSKRDESNDGITAWVDEVPSGPTIVVCEITTVVTPSLLEEAAESDDEDVGCDVEMRLSNKFPVVPAELVPVIPLKKSVRERLVEDELNVS